MNKKYNHIKLISENEECDLFLFYYVFSRN